MSKNFKISLIASLGSAIEYYDFVVYGLMAKYLSNVFFDFTDEYTQLINSFLIFSVGYFARPVGGIIGGMISDTYGRRFTFITVTALMAGSTFGIGLIPGYLQMGFTSCIILSLMRVLQGISFGAELPDAITIVKEYSDNNRLGKLLSILISGTTLGSIFATIVVTILATNFTSKEIIEFYWRIPFFIGGILGIIVFYIRKNIDETPEFLEYKAKTRSNNIFIPVKVVFSRYFTKILFGCGLTLFPAALIVINIYFPSYFSSYFGYEISDIYNSMLISIICSVFFLLIFGGLADIFLKKNILLFSLLSFSVFVFCFLKMNYISYVELTIFLIIYQLHLTAYFTSCLPILSGLFTVESRCTAIALVYNLSFCLASLFPSFVTFLAKKFDEVSILSVIFYIIILIAVISIKLMKICKQSF